MASGCLKPRALMAGEVLFELGDDGEVVADETLSYETLSYGTIRVLLWVQQSCV